MFAVAVVGCCGEQSVANREIRLASYNIFHCQGADKKIDFARTAAALGQGCPDFVGLQEVDSVTKRSKGLDHAAEMGKILGMHATYAKTFAFQGGGYGNACQFECTWRKTYGGDGHMIRKSATIQKQVSVAAKHLWRRTTSLRPSMAWRTLYCE